MPIRLLLIALLIHLPLVLPAAASDTTELRTEIQQMKANPRGPFQRIRWFCNDGTVLPPKPYACREHGGGIQHGEWSDSTRRIRSAGFPIANVLADLGPEDFGADAAAQRHLRMVLLEQFLIDIDDGWILRRARFYRGAFQIEDEMASARRILESFAADPEWRGSRYPMLVEAVRLLPRDAEQASAAEVRGLATALNNADPGFGELRNKIHNKPDAGDARRVRDYAIEGGQSELETQYEQLASSIEALYALPDPAERLMVAAPPGPVGKVLMAQAEELERAADTATAIHILSRAMQTIRDELAGFGSPANQVDALYLLLELEANVATRAQELVSELEGDSQVSRAAILELLEDLARATYGLGLLTQFEYSQMQSALALLEASPVPISAYRDHLAYLYRVAGWAGRRLAFFFEQPMAELAEIEPLAHEYIPDRLRGSPMLYYGRVLRILTIDSARLANVQHQLFGRNQATGLRRMNPGIGRGVLRTLEDLEAVEGDTGDSIVIVPHTVAELPPVAGILTEFEGNALSHVQLLARNLGIPNVVVGAELMPELLEHRGRRVLLAASPGGVVRLEDIVDAPDEAEETPAVTIHVDMEKLDLTTDRLVSTAELRQTDSGVRVGPKAAQLGELTTHFPDQVSPGLAIPFGAFRDVLDQPYEPGGPSTFEWMKANYAELAAIAHPGERSARTRAFLAALRNWIETTELDPAFLSRLRGDLQQQFGADGSYGVFVRSDTNVEDLPGFTGAGLNLTVPNVVGYDNIVKAIRRVWASPFSERAFGWRQALMDNPEHVYAAVLLHRSVNNDKSGVLVTADLDTNARDVLVVVANEGVGGGVEGQSAETLKVRVADGQVTLLNSATAPAKSVLLSAGGEDKVPASGADRLLIDAELDQIRQFSSRLPGWFTNVPEAERADTVADVEFGFFDGRLILYQIRPFVQSRGAAQSSYLRELDSALRETAAVEVDMNEPPLEAAS